MSKGIHLVDARHGMIHGQYDNVSEKNAEWFYEALSYLSKLDEDANICFYVTAFVRETTQVFTTQKVVAIDKPDLELEVSST